jgi:metal-responsive CopG/Arc/MetJ family transcriptional regulator
MSTLLQIRIPDELVKQIDKFADDEFTDRSKAVRELLTRGLAFGRRVLTGAGARAVLREVMGDAWKGPAK